MHELHGLNKYGEEEMKSFIRMKGVNLAALEEYEDHINMFERMYEGKTLDFDLTYGNGVVFKFGESVTTRESYIKKIGFSGEKGEL